MDHESKLTRDEFQQGLEVSIDAEASEAARQTGGNLISYGLVFEDAAGQLSWINRADRDFGAKIGGITGIRPVAFMGVTQQRLIWLHMHYDAQDEHTAAKVRSLGQALLDVPEDTLWFARLSRSEVARRIAAGLENEKFILAVGQVPECIEKFWCYETAEGPKVGWDKPSVPPSIN